MTESELRMAITGPAEAAGLRIDPALTDTILGDLRVAGADSSSGVLPLLSQAMALTWEHREDDRLTSRGYAQAGGVSHAVQTGADRAYGALPARHQAIARDVLRSMTVASRDGGLARRPGVQPQRTHAGQRQRRRHHPALGPSSDCPDTKCLHPRLGGVQRRRAHAR
jgi:hypothetical protein